MTHVPPFRVDLTEGWQLSARAGRIVPEALRGRSIPATVPGVVHTDLLAAGEIDDPYLDDNESRYAWIGSTDWSYRTTATLPEGEHDRVDLVIGGLDTVAAVSLDGEVVLRSANQHRSFRVAVPQSATGSVDIAVDFSAPIPAADAASLALGYRPHVNHHPYNALRKMACSFGWDWGIDTSTSGIWRPIALEAWSVARLDVVLPSTRVDGADGVASFTVKVERSRDDDLEVVVQLAGQSVVVPVHGTSAQVEVRVPDADLWWPRGYGAPALHPTTVELRTVAAGASLGTWSRELGFRTIELTVEPDEHGTPFTIVVNGQPIAVRGANWIPDDAFPHRVTRERYADRLEQAEFAGLNLIRVWGGGIYESDDFYAETDARGILVWQDFLLACAAYAEEEPLRSEIEAEAREAVTRLASHPSLAILNGNNENIWGYEEWNWQHRLDGATWGAHYYYELFPAIVNQLAPHVAYTPGSPYSPGTIAGGDGPAQNAESHGTMHIWDLWNQKDYPHYRDYRPRFVAEFGWQAPPTWSTLVDAIHDDPLTPESPGMLVHQKAIDGNVKLTDGLVAHLRLPNEMRAWHWAMQLNQAVAIRTAIEWYRSLRPHCMGTVVWQLNDCWPVTSWSAVDGNGRPKPLLYALRSAHADRLVTVQPDGEGLRVALVNDHGTAATGALRLTRRSVDGAVLAEWSAEYELPAHDSQSVAVPDEIAHTAASAHEFVVAEWAGERGLWFFAEYRDQPLTQPELRIAVTDAPADGHAHRTVSVSISSDVLVRDFVLEVDRVHPEARALAGLVTLLPGETMTIPVRLPAGVPADALRDTSLVRTANELVAGASA